MYSIIHYLHCTCVLYLQPQNTKYKLRNTIRKIRPQPWLWQSTNHKPTKYNANLPSKYQKNCKIPIQPRPPPPTTQAKKLDHHTPTQACQAPTPLHNHNRHLLTLTTSPLKLLQLKPLSYNNLHLPPDRPPTLPSSSPRTRPPPRRRRRHIYQFTITSPPRYPIDDVPRHSLIWPIASIHHFNRPTRHNTSPIRA